MIQRIRIISFKLKTHLALFIAIVTASGLKLWLYSLEAVPFNGDEAVVALMGRHILSGAYPIFFYGQAYMGSLDAWLVAAAFRLFGEDVFSIRIVQMVFYILYIFTLWLLGKRLFKDQLVSVFVVIIAAVPAVLVTTYTSASLGGYGEILVLGNLILLLGYELLYKEHSRKIGLFLAIGFISGIAFWTLGMAVVYIVPLIILFVWRYQKRWLGYYLLSFVFFLIGSSPWWIYNLTHDWMALRFLIIPNDVTINLTERMIGFFFLGVPTLLGLRFPWSPEYSPLPLLVVGIAFYTTAFIFSVRFRKFIKRQMNDGAMVYLIVFVICFFCLFIFSGFGIDATGRRILPLYLLVALFLAWFVAVAWRRMKLIGFSLLILILFLNGFETWRAAMSVDKLTTQFDPITRFDNQYDQALMDFLTQNGETQGYSNYWVSFRLAFLSQEKIIFAPQIPYKINLIYSSSDNRYPEYTSIVDSSTDVAYITSKHPVLDDLLRSKFSALNVSFSEAQIGDYHVFYELSRKVHPYEVGFGVDSQ